LRPKLAANRFRSKIVNPVRIASPEWLKSRGGELRGLPDGLAYAVMMDSKPLYVLKPVPADGKYACDLVQSNSGHRIPSDSIHASAEDAIRSGLEELRKSLGW
jgi:hypothetical protein